VTRSAAEGRRGAAKESGRLGARDEIPALEWAAAAVGAVLLVATIAFLLREAARPGEPGPVAFRVVSVRPVSPGFLVEFEARNEGGKAYAELEVEGTLRSGGGEERARATLDYLPRRSTRRGGFFFEGDPRQGEVEIVAKGFREP
jgi:uncharacterized protein (TIGR02588 family)